MITQNVHEHLIESINLSFSEITDILKALGNEKRMQILVLLLKGPQSYSTIVQELDLKKTAVSNHLTQLRDVNLIKREGNGVYEITGDGLQFIRAIENAFQKSPTRQADKFDLLQRRGISESFLERFPK
ncbi:MAG: ArsR/SmtB family transcription factor [Candidatus Odinarchaeota archaeon]